MDLRIPINIVVFLLLFFLKKQNKKQQQQKSKLEASILRMMIMMNCFTEWLTDESKLFPARTITGNSHYRKHSTRRRQELNLHRT